METARAGDGLPPYEVTARNIAAQSENKIHSDDVARGLGFQGALISGVAVFSYMTRPLLARHGEAWLASGSAETTFFKPAYEGDLVSIKVEPDGEGGGALVRAIGPGEVELARMESRSEDAPPLTGVETLGFKETPEGAERPPANWDTIVLNEPMWTLPWHPDAEENAAWVESVMDDLPLYRGPQAPLHPGLVMRAANWVLKHQFVLPAWIHMSSKVNFRSLLRVGEEIQVRAVPVEKYEKKGHQIAVFHVLLVAGGRIAVEVVHKVIFRVRPAA